MTWILSFKKNIVPSKYKTGKPKQRSPLPVCILKRTLLTILSINNQYRQYSWPVDMIALMLLSWRHYINSRNTLCHTLFVCAIFNLSLVLLRSDAQKVLQRLLPVFLKSHWNSLNSCCNGDCWINHKLMFQVQLQCSKQIEIMKLPLNCLWFCSKIHSIFFLIESYHCIPSSIWDTVLWLKILFSYLVEALWRTR